MIRWNLWRKWLSLLTICLLSQGYAQAWELRVCADPNNLPYSNQRGEGFENRIAEILVGELGGQLSYFWLPPHHSLARDVDSLQTGACDLLMGVYDGQDPFLTTLAYYQSSYVFVYPESSTLKIESLDNPILRTLRIAIQAPGSPPDIALANRGLTNNVHHYPTDLSQANPLKPIFEALANGDVDLAIVWGPVAGYFAQLQSKGLRLVPVTPEFEPGLFVSMVYSIAIGVRAKDESLRNLLNRALVRRWEEIQTVLQQYKVPLLPLPKPEIGEGE